MKMLGVAAASVVLGFGTASAPLLGQAPRNLDQVPLYPGAVRQPDREAELVSPGEVSRTVWVYRVKAPIEDVVRFYLPRLQAHEIRTDADRERANDAMERLAPGQATAITLEFEPVDLSPDAFAELAAGGDRSAAQLAAATRAAYAKDRTPFRPDTWIASATFAWAARPDADRRLMFDLSLEDVEAWEIRETTYHHQTEIAINFQQEGPVAAMEQPAEQPPAAPMAAPSESALGVPLYPGAKFDGRVSAQMSASDEEGIYYVYTSTDTPQQVTTFYQARTGKKGITNEGGTMIAVKGEGLFPELGVTIQPNMGTYPPTVKTMLAIRKRR